LPLLLFTPLCLFLLAQARAAAAATALIRILHIIIIHLRLCASLASLLCRSTSARSLHFYYLI